MDNHLPHALSIVPGAADRISSTDSPPGGSADQPRRGPGLHDQAMTPVIVVLAATDAQQHGVLETGSSLGTLAREGRSIFRNVCVEHDTPVFGHVNSN